MLATESTHRSQRIQQDKNQGERLLKGCIVTSALMVGRELHDTDKFGKADVLLRIVPFVGTCM